MNEQKKLVTFLDGMERTVIGELVDKSEGFLQIRNPVVVNIVPQMDQVTQQPTGQMALQLLPLFFKEFLGDKSTPIEYKYRRDRITEIEFDGGFDFRLYAQYDHIFDNSPIITPSNAGPIESADTSDVIDLFGKK